MSENIEIEFKNLLTATEFELLLNKFNISDSDFFYQANHYYDTVDFKLKSLKSALRIREKNGEFELTLKTPTDDNIGLLEINQNLKSIPASLAEVTKGSVVEKIKDFEIPLSELKTFGTLATYRVEFPYKSGLLVLDRSEYLGITDFEMEFEVPEYKQGEIDFKEILCEVGIESRKTKNKVRRFYDALNAESKS